MKDAIIAIVVVLVLAAGFWFTRGGGGIPGGLDDPAAEARTRLTPTGEPAYADDDERDDASP